MSKYVTKELLAASLESLYQWVSHIAVQKRPHVWSLLPPKLAGAEAGVAISFEESDDFAFMDRFLRQKPEPAADPYFDPFSLRWLKAGYPHSNSATFRKNRFDRSWGACSWVDGTLRLTPEYADIFVSKVLTKSGSVSRIPALACAVWFYKKPATEWPMDHPFRGGLPEEAAEVLAQFRMDFHFTVDAEWSKIFDSDPALLPAFASIME